MHSLDPYLESFQKRIENAKTGFWVPYEPVIEGQNSAPFIVKITNLEELQEQNPLTAN